jgi:polyisoprenoid-binding protein YceI
MKTHTIISRILLAVVALSLIAIVSSLAVPAETESFVEPAPAGKVSAPIPGALRYRIDPAKSNITVRAYRSGLLKAFGHDHTIAVRDFSGEIEITPDVLAPASLQLNIKADSLAITDKVSDDERAEIENTMKTQVLETGKYPQITFKSTNVAAEKAGDSKFTAKIWGDIGLHGATGNGYIVSQVSFTGNSLRATGAFSLKQTDYKINPPSVAGGTIKVKDELKFTFDIVAVQ